MASLQKKLKEIRLLKDVKLETDYIQLGKALEELGVVVQQIRDDMAKAKRSGWNKSFVHGYIKAKKEDSALLVEDSKETKKDE